LRIVDASPGRYAFEELEAVRAAFEASGSSPEAYYARLDALVVKHADRGAPRARKVVRIPNGVERRYLVSGRASTPRYLVSGRIAPSKRLGSVLEAFARVRSALPVASLEVFGVAEPRHAHHAASLVAAAGPGVVFRGASFDLAYLEEPWTAAVIVGTNQGCPNAVLEAMAAGIAVIANASGGTGELVVHGESGWLLPEDADAGAIAAAMLEAWCEPGKAATRSVQGRACAQERFGMPAMAARYLEVLAPATAACGSCTGDLTREKAQVGMLKFPSNGDVCMQAFDRELDVRSS